MRRWLLDREFESSAGRVRYASFGQGAPLILMHGTPFSSYEWHRIAPILAEYATVFVYDMPGYGASEKRDGQDVSLASQSEVFCELLDHWQLTGPCVIAHDFGGATALRAHLLHAVEFASLLLVDPVALRPWGSPFVQHVRLHEAAFAGVPDYLQEAIVPAYVRSAIHRAITDSELAPYVEPWLGVTGKPALYRQIAQMDERYTAAFEPQLGRMRCPVTLLWGEEDRWLPLHQGQELARRMNVRRFASVPDSGHLMQEDAPERIVAEALPILRSGG